MIIKVLKSRGGNISLRLKQILWVSTSWGQIWLQAKPGGVEIEEIMGDCTEKCNKRDFLHHRQLHVIPLKRSNHSCRSGRRKNIWRKKKTEKQDGLILCHPFCVWWVRHFINRFGRHIFWFGQTRHFANRFEPLFWSRTVFFFAFNLVNIRWMDFF